MPARASAALELPQGTPLSRGAAALPIADELRAPPELRELGELRDVQRIFHRHRGADESADTSEILRLAVAPDPRSPPGEAELRVYLFEPRLGLAADAPVVVYAHGGSIRPEPILGASILPALVNEARARALGCRFVAVAHRGSSSHATKGRFTLADRVADLALARRLATSVTGADAAAPTLLIGNSMGGHVSLMALRELAALGVALLCPAIYSAEAHTLPLGPAFTAAIRKPASWRGSPAFAALREHLRAGGRALLLAKRADEVIPAEVTETLALLLREHGGGRCSTAYAPGRHAAIAPQTVTSLVDFIRSFPEVKRRGSTP